AARVARRRGPDRSRSRAATICGGRAPILRTPGEWTLMTMPSLIWGSPGWLTYAGTVMGVAVAVLLWSYLRAPARRSVKLTAAILKAVGFSALALSLL